MSDLIDKKNMAAAIEEHYEKLNKTKRGLTANEKTIIKEIIRKIDNFPTEKPRWVGADSYCGIGCSICGTPVDDFCTTQDYISLIYKPNHCPNCGVRMVNGEGDKR